MKAIKDGKVIEIGEAGFSALQVKGWQRYVLPIADETIPALIGTAHIPEPPTELLTKVQDNEPPTEDVLVGPDTVTVNPQDEE